MAKQVLFGDDALSKMKKGVDTLANAVKTTLGPSGRNVVLDKGYGAPQITKDGVTVAMAVDPEDPVEKAGAMLAREVAMKTNNEAGDGTTTATVLAQAILDAGYRAVASGANPIYLKRGIDRAVSACIAKLKEVSSPIGKGDVERIASISANDTAIGKVIAGTMAELGGDGYLTVEESKSVGVTGAVIPGMRLDKGFVSPYLVTDANRMEAVYEDCLVLVTDKKISYLGDLVPITEKIAKAGKKSILLIAEDFDNEALSTIVHNHLRGSFHILAVKAPSFGENKKDILADIATLTGATVVSDDTGLTFKDLAFEQLGVVSKVIATKEYTTLMEGAGAKEFIEARVKMLKEQLSKADSQYDKDRLTSRIAKLTGGIGVIRVGAATETETQEIKDRVEDAISATKAALEEGILPGGGMALLNCRLSLKELTFENKDTQLGVEIVRESLTAPLKQIAENCGKSGEVVLSKCLSLTMNEGYDAATDAYVDLIEEGIIDPTKVTRLALENAASIASILLTSSAAIITIKEKTNH